MALGIEIYRDRPRTNGRATRGEVVMATEPLDLDGVAREPGASQPWSGLDAGTRIGHVHLHVPDLDGAERFYCDAIGFAPTLRRYPGALFVAAGLSPSPRAERLGRAWRAAPRAGHRGPGRVHHRSQRPAAAAAARRHDARHA